MLYVANQTGTAIIAVTAIGAPGSGVTGIGDTGVEAVGRNGPGLRATSDSGDLISAGSPDNPVFRVANNGEVYSGGQRLNPYVRVATSDSPVPMPWSAAQPVITLNGLAIGRYIISANLLGIRGSTSRWFQCYLTVLSDGRTLDFSTIMPTGQVNLNPMGNDIDNATVVFQDVVFLYQADDGVAVECQDRTDYPPEPEEIPYATQMRLVAQRIEPDFAGGMEQSPRKEFLGTRSVYDGTATTDGRGNATVALPPDFEAMYGDFRYQLTVIGQFAQAIVASEIKDGRFTIKTSAKSVKVSWQVTGARKSTYSNATASR
jgi:hypothetical protein